MDSNLLNLKFSFFIDFEIVLRILLFNPTIFDIDFLSLTMTNVSFFNIA